MPVDEARPDSSEPPPLRLRTKLAFGIGSAAETIALFSLGSYALLYYNQVLGLPGWLGGMAISLSFVVDGFADPVIGSISDRTRSRFGRRHPFMYAAPIPIALFFLAIFNPPDGLSHTLLFLWFTGSVIGLRVAMSVFHTPHLAFGSELSESYIERSKVMAWNNFSTWIGGTSISLIALTYFFKATPEYPRGLLNPEPYLPFSLLAAGATLTILFGSAWFTRDQIPRLPRPPKDQPPFSPFEFLKDLGKILANRNYVWLLAGLFALSLMTGIRDTLGLYGGTYYWGFPSEMLRWYSLGSLVGFVSALTLTPRLHARWGKRAVIIASAAATVVFPALGFMLREVGWMFPNGDPRLLPTLVVISVVSYATGAILNISVMSALADVADENEVRFGVRQEGVLYSTRALFAKLDTAIGAALAGIVLTLIAFPEKAQPGEVDPGVLQNLGLFLGPISMIPGVFAVLLYSRFSISSADHAATRAKIEAARREAPAVPN
jgi:GPH family glycoside/pentoside/hexuronide:cation symporter